MSPHPLPSMAVTLALILLASVASAQQSGATYVSTVGGTPMLGVEMSPVPLSIQSQDGISVDQGVYVRQVFPNTAASGMGIQNGDVITQVNGAPIGSMTDLRNQVGYSQIGDPVSVVVNRAGQPAQLNGVLGQWPSGIPRDPINPGAEQQFRQWQQDHIGGAQQVLNQIQQQLSNIGGGLLGHPGGQGGAASGAPRRDGGQGDGQQTLAPALVDALALLSVMPAWELKMSSTYDDQEPLVTMAQPELTPVESGDWVPPAPEAAWAVSYHYDSRHPRPAAPAGTHQEAP